MVCGFRLVEMVEAGDVVVRVYLIFEELEVLKAQSFLP
jgi:hypothetical protein